MEGPDSDCIMMNVDLIAKVTGWPAKTRRDVMAWPDRIKTWDDFTKLAVALTRRSGNKITVAGFNVPDLSWLDWFASVLASNGIHFYNKDFTGVNLNTPQALECVQWLLHLQNKYKVSQPPNAQRNDEHELLAGHAAMIADGTWGDYQIHDSNPNFRLMMMPIPRGPHGTRKGTVTFTNMVSMARNVKNPELAWKFAKFMSVLSTQVRRLEILARFAPLRSFFESPQWKAAVLKDPALIEVPRMAQIGDVYPFVHSAELYDKVGPIMSQISLGKVTPRAGLVKAQKVADSILSGV
jgi:ABC-type glycerol-3-phosphate transport system substrate-binding protein